jgi:hypothetical protein
VAVGLRGRERQRGQRRDQRGRKGNPLPMHLISPVVDGSLAEPKMERNATVASRYTLAKRSASPGHP